MSAPFWTGPSAHFVIGMKPQILKTWQIRVYRGTSEERAEIPFKIGYVQSRNSAQAIIFAHEALCDDGQAFTVELEITDSNSGIELEREYQVEWNEVAEI